MHQFDWPSKIKECYYGDALNRIEEGSIFEIQTIPHPPFGPSI
jgi:hypothetical protein